jgi:hypothetical protein
MPNRNLQQTRWLDQHLAAPMFAAAFAVLVLFSLILHVNQLGDPTEVARTAGWILVAIYPLFWIETLCHFVVGSPRIHSRFWACAIPVLRMCTRDLETGKFIWLPLSGWAEVDPKLERTLAKRFSIPMIIVALFVLPVITIEFVWSEFVEQHPGWRYSLQVATALIWTAFTYEFTIMLSVVRFKSSYLRRHWIDAAIIMLPTIAFFRAARLAQLARVKQIARAARVYRLRGLGIRFWRALVTLQVVEKILSRNPEHRLEKLQLRLEEKMDEINILREDIERLKTRIREKSLKSSNEAAPPLTGDTQSETGQGIGGGKD